MKKSLLYSLMALVATSASAGSNFPTNGKLAKLTEQYRTKEARDSARKASWLRLACSEPRKSQDLYTVEHDGG